MKRPFLLPFGIIFLLFISCSNDDNNSPAPIPEDTISLVNAFPNLDFSRPLDLQSPEDGSNRLFVVEQGGAIKVFENDESVENTTTFFDIGNRIASSGELGLLGLAFHPNFGTNGFFYVTYTPSNDLALVSRFKVSATNPNLADITSETVLLRIPQPFDNHNGGQLAFGPDGYLYISSGDGGGAGDPNGNAQNLNNLLGKILRIDVNVLENGLEYSIPAENPFVDTQDARAEIFAYGLRNPWRFSFDVQSGRLWAGDVGQGELEEIDIIQNGGNYGWNILEGTRCYNAVNCESEGTIAPVFEYNHDSNDKSVTGGYVYRGSLVPSLKGFYIYGDFISGRIWALSTNLGGNLNNQLLLETGLNISSFGTDDNNELFVCSFDGNIYRFEEKIE
ncbi:PQQ-dependent sugar dehydrogenase [Maribacter aestuarii]|uniref:PQQ-dependent sugar dehydrogenase n=1 Tax=Maribacter aestuarii TaxID=1130723 RepID=UPI00248ACEF4|nr:PQQ-dependent sugar dehydrogenase [Maribacter aestuarii]